MAKKKRRTPAQIRATKKLVRLAKARARKAKRGNPRGPGWASVRATKKAWKKHYPGRMTKTEKREALAWGSGFSKRSKGRAKPHRTNKCNPRRKSQPKVTLAQAKRLYQLGRSAPKTAVAIKRRGSKVSIVTGKAARKLARRS